MRKPRLIAALAALLLMVFTTSNVFAADEVFSAWTQDFDTNTNGWLSEYAFGGGTHWGTIVQVPSGTDGITSASGGGHAKVSSGAAATDEGPFSYFDNHRSV